MRYRNLGRTGIKVSPYALGALMLATQVGNPDPEDSIRIIHKALDAGINLVDTADAYGDSEEVVGRALKGRRDNVVPRQECPCRTAARPAGPRSSPARLVGGGCLNGVTRQQRGDGDLGLGGGGQPRRQRRDG